jgi:hypothetical protein
MHEISSGHGQFQGGGDEETREWNKALSRQEMLSGAL